MSQQRNYQFQPIDTSETASEFLRNFTNTILCIIALYFVLQVFAWALRGFPLASPAKTYISQIEAE